MKENTNNRKHRAGIIALIIIMLGIFCMGSAMLLTRTLSGSIGINPFAWNMIIEPLDTNDTKFTITESGDLILDMSAFQFTDSATALNLDLRITNPTSINSGWYPKVNDLSINGVQAKNSSDSSYIDPTGIIKSVELFVMDTSGVWTKIGNHVSSSGSVINSNYLIAGNSHRDIRIQFNFIMPVSLNDPIIYDILYNFTFQPGTPTNAK